MPTLAFPAHPPRLARPSATRLAAVMLTLGLAACGEPPAAASTAPASTASPASISSSSPTTPPALAPRSSARVFFSGHSLMDIPVPTDVEAIARSLGTGLAWNRQYVVGSSIRLRTRGRDEFASDWTGYRSGDNRQGRDMDVLAELREPRTLGTPGPYDTLVIAEGSGVLGTLMHFDSVRYLRHFHERFIDSNPSGQTYLYQPWSSLGDKRSVPAWVAFEREANTAWQCIVTRVNVSLQAEGRPDRILALPASGALAELIAQAISPAGVPGLSTGDELQTVNRLINDDIHTTRLGAYFMGLVTYAAVYRRSPEGSWAPDDVSPELARALQTFAWRYVSDFYRQPVEANLERCRAFMTGPFCDTYWRKEGSKKWLGLKRMQQVSQCRSRFARNDAQNPLHYDPATDKDYWFKAP